MTRLDVIRRIGDVLTEIDVAVGSLRPGDPDMLRLQDLRRLLDARQLMIARRSFDEHTPAFQAAVAKLTAASDATRTALAHVEDMATLLSSVTRFLSAVTEFMALAGALT